MSLGPSFVGCLTNKESRLILETIHNHSPAGLLTSDLRCPLSRGVTGNFFFWGGGAKSFFLIFSRRDFRVFPVEISILVDPLKVSLVSWKWKVEKKVLSFFSVLFTLKFFCFFSFSFSFFQFFFLHFPPSLFHFFSFSSTFSILLPFFFLASFFPICHQKFPGGKSLGGHSSPLLRHCHWV